jgi:hypothetical protein
MTHAHNFREPTNDGTRFIDDTPPVSRVRRMIRTLRRAQADATYLNQRMLELPK